MKNKVIIIAGPTGVGKTKLSINVAKKIDAEIISSDSMQIYRDMDIGTAKIKEDEKEGIKHHLIDIISPFDAFTVSDFNRESTKAVKEIESRNKRVVVAGGTGLYINTLLYDMDFNNTKIDESYRKYLWNFYYENGEDELFKLLISVSPDTKIEKQNIKRVIRALEIYKQNGGISEFNQIKKREDIESNIFILNRDREVLYDNINKRVDIMIENGLIEEVISLKERGLDASFQSMKAIGYIQIFRYLEGEYSKDRAIEIIKQESRRYAKRQLTWFKRYKDAKWFDLDKDNLNYIEEYISNI